MIEQGNNSFNFYGEFTCKVDAKSRVRLPGEMIDQLKVIDNQTFIMNRGEDGQIILFPKPVWEEKLSALRQLNRFDSKSRDFTRLFMRGVSTVKLDAGNRLLIPKKLVEYAGISKEIAILALFDQFEIWDTDKYEAFVINRSQEDFQKLGQEVMVDNKPLDDNSKE